MHTLLHTCVAIYICMYVRMLILFVGTFTFDAYTQFYTVNDESLAWLKFGQTA